VLFLLFFLGLICLIVVKSIVILGADEMGVLSFLGKPIGFCDSGFNFVLFPLYAVTKRPKTMFNLDYPATEVITCEGKYHGVKYGAQVIKVDAVAYLNFSRGANKKNNSLIRIVESKVPYDQEGLKIWTADSVVGSLFSVFAGKTWMEAIEEIELLKKVVGETFRDPDGALVKAGFDPPDLKLTIKGIKLPPDLEKALTGPDKERLKMLAAGFVAKRQSLEWVGMVVEAIAYSEGKSIKAVQKQIDADPKMKKEIFKYAQMINLRLEEAERGAVTHVVVDGGDTDGKVNQNNLLGDITKRAIEFFAAFQGMQKTKKAEVNNQEEEKAEVVVEEEEIKVERVPSEKEERVMKNVRNALAKRKKK